MKSKILFALSILSLATVAMIAGPVTNQLGSARSPAAFKGKIVAYRCDNPACPGPGQMVCTNRVAGPPFWHECKACKTNVALSIAYPFKTQ